MTKKYLLNKIEEIENITYTDENTIIAARQRKHLEKFDFKNFGFKNKIYANKEQLLNHLEDLVNQGFSLSLNGFDQEFVY